MQIVSLGISSLCVRLLTFPLSTLVGGILWDVSRGTLLDLEALAVDRGISFGISAASTGMLSSLLWEAPLTWSQHGLLLGGSILLLSIVQENIEHHPSRLVRIDKYCSYGFPLLLLTFRLIEFLPY